MKKLPRFVTINSPELSNTMVLETLPPYLIGAPRGIPKKDTEAVEAMMSAIANGRTAAAKIPGFTLFFHPFTTLLPSRLPDDELKSRLRDMADFYVETVFSRNKHKHRAYQEDVPDDIDEINGRRIKEAKAERRKIFLEHK